ncbi:MAG: hypothetical protein R3C49_09215 [Planctomycetaceae bacterium]
MSNEEKCVPLMALLSRREGLPAPICSAIDQPLSREPHDRYDSLREFPQALQNC